MTVGNASGPLSLTVDSGAVSTDEAKTLTEDGETTEKGFEIGSGERPSLCLIKSEAWRRL